jgi:hypothetical protein
MGQGHNDDDDTRRDLTRIEDLSEFLHEEDPELESKFGEFNPKKEETQTGLTGGVDLAELGDDQESPPEIPVEIPTEETDNSQQSGVESWESADDSFQSDETESSEVSFEETPFEETPQEESPFENSFELSTEDNEFNLVSNEDIEAETDNGFLSTETETETDNSQLPTPSPQPPTDYSSQEKFDEVKTFAQNFSYGQIQGGGNPPFSLVIRNLKYQEESADIIALLTEFGLVNAENLADTTRALELGSLLIPQINEYSAIVLAHKLRRYDCDLEMGLSDEVHPSKSGEHNPKGLMKKDSLRQNKTETYHKDEEDVPGKEVLVTTTSSLEGYAVRKYIGVQTSFAIVDEDELERLKYVQSTKRSGAPMRAYETEANVEFSSERAFLDYQSSFDHLFVDLLDQLKGKAIKERANALLGLSYQLSSLPFEKTSQGKGCFQLTCSATMAVVKPE